LKRLSSLRKTPLGLKKKSNVYSGDFLHQVLRKLHGAVGEHRKGVEAPVKRVIDRDKNRDLSVRVKLDGSGLPDRPAVVGDKRPDLARGFACLIESLDDRFIAIVKLTADIVRRQDGIAQFQNAKPKPGHIGAGCPFIRPY
jgi:hypothetical protein